MAALAEDAEASTNLSNDKVVTMYKDAASIVNQALDTMLTKVRAFPRKTLLTL